MKVTRKFSELTEDRTVFTNRDSYEVPQIVLIAAKNTRIASLLKSIHNEV